MCSMSFKLNPGVNHCSNSEYHRDNEYLSSSDYKLLLKSPAELYEKKYGPKKVEESKDFYTEGSVVHTLILEPHLFSTEYAVYPGLRKAGREFEAFKAANTDRTIISKPQEQRCKYLLEGYRKLPQAVSLITGGYSEHTVCLNYNGINTKVRADYININESYIVDVKTTAYESDLHNFKLTMEHWDYGLSAALYTKIMELHYGKPFTFYWLVLSKKDGTCDLYKMSDRTRMAGDRKIAKAQEIYKQCVSTGIWEASAEDRRPELGLSNYEIQEI